MILAYAQIDRAHRAAGADAGCGDDQNGAEAFSTAHAPDRKLGSAVDVDTFYLQAQALKTSQVRPLADYQPHDPRQVVVALIMPDRQTLQLAGWVLEKLGFAFEIFVGPTGSRAAVPRPGASSAPADLSPYAPPNFADLRRAVAQGGRVQWHAEPELGANVEAEARAPTPAPVANALRQGLVQLGAKGAPSPHLRWMLAAGSVVAVPTHGDQAMGKVSAQLALTAAHLADFAGTGATSVAICPSHAVATTLEAARAVAEQLRPTAEASVLASAEVGRALADELPAGVRCILRPVQQSLGQAWGELLAASHSHYVLLLEPGVVPRIDATAALVGALEQAPQADVAFADCVLGGEGAAAWAHALAARKLPQPLGAAPRFLAKLHPAAAEGVVTVGRLPSTRPPGLMLCRRSAWLRHLAHLPQWGLCSHASLLAALGAEAWCAHVALPLASVHVAPAHVAAAVTPLAQELGSLRQQLAEAEEQTMRTALAAETAVAEMQSRLQLKTAALEIRCGSLAEENAVLQEHLSRLQTSSSWRWTQPARQLKAQVQKAGSKLPAAARLTAAFGAGEREARGDS